MSESESETILCSLKRSVAVEPVRGCLSPSAARARGFPRSHSSLTGVFCHITHTFRAKFVRAGFDPDPHPSTKKVNSTFTEQNWPRSCSSQKTELHTTRFEDPDHLHVSVRSGSPVRSLTDTSESGFCWRPKSRTRIRHGCPRSQQPSPDWWRGTEGHRPGLRSERRKHSPDPEKGGRSSSRTTLSNLWGTQRRNMKSACVPRAVTDEVKALHRKRERGTEVGMEVGSPLSDNGNYMQTAAESDCFELF